MKQLTIRGFEDDLERCLRALAREENISLNQAALRLLRRGAGLLEGATKSDRVGDSLDHLIGTWSEEQAKRMEEVLADCEQVDEALWR